MSIPRLLVLMSLLAISGWLHANDKLMPGSTKGPMKGPMKGPGIGQPATTEQIAAYNTSIFPDGMGLPVGKGTAVDGEPVYQQHCLACHGPKGVGASAEELAGGMNPLTDPEYPDKTIGTYWPYATTVFDFTRRGMPLNAPGSLSNDELYAVTAYLLYINGIIAKDLEMDAQSLPRVVMPNRKGFFSPYRVAE